MSECDIKPEDSLELLDKFSTAAKGYALDTVVKSLLMMFAIINEEYELTMEEYEITEETLH